MKEENAAIKWGVVCEDKIPVIEIEKGYMRTAVGKTKEGDLFFMLMASEEYAEPGKLIEDGAKCTPVAALKVWGIEHLRILAKCFNMAADQLEEMERENE